MKTTDNQNELFYWVDASDSVMGHITRNEAHNSSLKLHRGVWALVFNDKKELFLQKRSFTKDSNPGLWSLSVGGHVTYGETYEEAIKREFKEELGVFKSQFTFLHKYLLESKTERAIDCVYKMNHEGPFILNQQEIDEGRFISLPDLDLKIRQGEMTLTKWALAILHTEYGILPGWYESKKYLLKTF